MILHNGSIALNWEDLIKGGINEDTLKKASYRNSESWPFFQLGNRLHILWQDIRESYRTMLENNIGNPYNALAAQVIMPHVVCKDSDREFLQNYTDEDGRSLTLEKQQQYIQACAFLNLLDGMTKPRYQAMGYPRRAAFDEAISSLIKANGVKLPTATCKLIVKLQAYRQQGAIAVIDGRTGNQNTRVLNEEQQRWLMAAYADHRKPTVEVLYNVYLRHCKEVGWKAVSISTVKAFLAKKSTRHIVEIERDPKIWKEKFGYTITTAKPVNPCALYESDGTKLNLFYRESDGRTMAKLQMYIVVDIASECIIGYSFGYSENTERVKAAWRMAIARTGKLPKQSRFDNGASHKSAEVDAFINSISDIHFRSTAYNGQSKYIEGIIGRFQSQHLRFFHNFTGMNVRAKKDDSRVNESYLKSNPHLIPTKEEAIAQAVAAMEAWNHDTNKKGIVRASIFNDEKLNIGRKLTEMDKINIFYDERESKITRTKDGITMIHEGVEHFFDVHDERGLVDMDFHLSNTNVEFIIKWNPKDISHIYLLDKNDKRVVAKATRIKQIAGSVHDAEEGTRELLNANLDLKKQQAQRMLDLVAELKEENQVKLSHKEYFKDALNRAEGDWLTTSIAEAAPLPKPTKRITPTKENKNTSPFLADDFQEGGELNSNNK